MYRRLSNAKYLKSYYIPLSEIAGKPRQDFEEFWKRNISTRVDTVGDTLFLLYYCGYLVFFLSFDVKDNVCEIYDVWTDRAFLRQGIATKGLEMFIAKKLAPVHWLGVVDINIISLYEKIGFKRAGETNTSPHGKIFDFTFQSMELKEEKSLESP